MLHVRIHPKIVEFEGKEWNWKFFSISDNLGSFRAEERQPSKAHTDLGRCVFCSWESRPSDLESLCENVGKGGYDGKLRVCASQSMEDLSDIYEVRYVADSAL
ncbi:hypothetical protein NPIL_701991 [Nephila pilipes]|uniref:Uncharacterized protein n=1 Tax=Nephila pilipes TaxID=299642 RepID=A0A8X6UD34_NEPPI|nr:hypothetical protein NPIL_701991 [Nephila pilipes]